MSKLQLLSPAGSFDALKAAIDNGADAVYLGSKLFNARRLANNFTGDELKQAVQYAHLHNVKIYLTLNTLIKNNEIVPLLNQVSLAAQLNIDALIMQDLTFAPLIKQHFPKLEIHASTQSTIMNSPSVKYWQPYVDTFVLARELTKQEVKTIYENTNKELEVFVHGHLCISYSGQCLISSLIGKRSGNRGVCASSCRKNYNQQGYLISAKDLMLANSIDKIYTLGINVVKIEGRMKSPEYVAATTRTYRQQIDAVQEKHFKPLSEQQVNNLKMGFNRDFTTGFFNNNPSIVGAEMPMNRGIFLGTIQDGGLQLEHDLNLLDGVGFWHSRSDGKLKGGIAYKILSEGEEIRHARRGDRIKIVSLYFINNAKVYLTSHNEGQDVLAENLLSLSLNVIAKVDQPLMFQYNDIKVHSLTQLQEANAAGVEIIYYDIFNSDVYEAKRLCTRAKFFLDTPVVATDSDIERIQQIVDTIKPDGITIGNWGILGVVFNGEKHGKYSLNVFNDISSAALLAQGVLPTLSVELNAKQALKMQNKKLIYYAHGQLPVMHFKGVYSPKALTDEKKYTFPLRIVNDNTEMLYSRPIAVLDKVKELMDGGVKYFLLDLTKDTSKIIKSYQNILLGVEQDISFLKKGKTLGNYGKGVA